MDLMSDISIMLRGSHLYFSRMLAEYEISTAEQYVLMFLLGHQEVNQDAVAKYYLLDKGTVARCLARLESKGLITRRINEENQREKIIALTDEALKLKETLVNVLDDWKNILYEGLSPEEIYHFESIAEKISKNVMRHTTRRELNAK